YVVVRHVVEIGAQRQALTTEADDLLRGQIELANARAVQVARRDHVDRNRPGRRQRTADLRRGRRLVGCDERVVGEQRDELVGADVGLVLVDRAHQHVDARDRVRRQSTERRLDRRLDVAVRIEEVTIRSGAGVFWNRRTDGTPVVHYFARAGAAGEREAVGRAHVHGDVNAVEHARVVADVLRR